MLARFGALPEAARPAIVETLVQFAVAMLILAMTRLYALHVDARLADVASQFQGDIAILVLLVAVISLPMMVGRYPPRWLIRGLFLAINLLQIGQAQYLLVTGSYASPALLHYAVLNPGDVAGAASTAINLFTPIMAVAAGVLVFFGGYPVGRLTEHPLSRRWAPLFTLFFFAACLWSIDGFSNVRNPGAISNALGIADFRRIDLPVVLDPLPGYAAPTVVSGPTRKPDVVLLILESTRADAIEGEAPGMPYLAELAKDSRSFERAYTTTSHTSKALVGIHCGMYPRPELTITENQPGGLPLSCLPRILGDLGYYTAYLQSADGSFENRYGLAENLGYSLFRPREKLDPGFKEAGYLGKDEFAMLGPARDAARAAGSRPLLLTVLTSVTHYPYVLPGTITKRYSARSADPMSAYRRTLAHADAFVREFVATLSRERDINNTLLIVVSDHGEAFGEHGFYVHDEAMYEEVVRGVLMIRYPGLVAAGRDTELRQGIDLLPTVLDVLGIGWQGQLPGISLMRPEGHSHVVTSCWNNNACQAGIRSDGLKLIHYSNGYPSRLYNLKVDSRETMDLMADSRYARDIAEMLSRISMQRDLVRRTYMPPASEGNRR